MSGNGKRGVQLGDLERGRVFWYSGRKYRVRRNLGPAGVSVQLAATTEVRIGDRVFEAAARGSEVWSAGSPVEIQ